MKVIVYNVLVLLGISVLFFGCSKSDNPASPSGSTAIMKINMVDGSADFTEVNIVIDSVQAHISTGDSTSGWYTLNNVPSTYNLLTLVNGNSTVIAEDTLPAGKYSQIRLFVGSGSTVMAKGWAQPLALTTPSGSQSGVKLNVNADILEGITYELTIDFDAGQSIVTTGSPTSPKYILKPVIRVVSSATTGIISGIVLPDTVSANIWAVLGSDSTSTSKDTTGAFKLLNLLPDTYKVHIIPNNTDFKDTTITNVVVTVGNTTDISTITLHK